MDHQPKKAIYMPQEDLKEKYKLPRIDRIQAYCKSIKSIGLATQLDIKVENSQNGTVHVIVTAHPQSPQKDFDKAVGYIIGEFIRGDCQVKYPDVKGISGPSKAKKEIDEQIQRSLQNEGHRCLPISEEILKKHDLLTSCELRQFRCPKCLQPFWRTVLHHKPVASCKQCNLPLCPLKRTEEFGIGRFICGNPTCSNVFYGRCQATDTRQCKNCLKDVKEPYIHPRFRPPFGPLPPGVQKPPARTYNQVSKVHTRTGSTISDFVRQWDETTCTDSLRPDDDDGDNDSGDDGDGPPPQMPTIDFEKGEACHDSDEEDDYDPEAERRRPHGSIPAQEGIDGDSEDSDSD